MKLFDDIDRTFKGPANHNENTFDYYQRCVRKDISIIRNKLNEWFQDCPDSEKKELKNSFKKSFDDCFFELFLFQLFQNLGFKIIVHPNLKNSSKRPDFLVSRDNLELYVEAKIVKDKSKKEEGLERKINKFYDDFSRIKIKGFLLCIDEFVVKTKQQPNSKAALRHIENELKNIDPEKLIKDFENNGFDRIPIIKFEDEDLKITVKPMPVIPSAGTKENKRPIGIYPGEIFWGGGEESMRESINFKAKKYGELDKPFIVCINSLNFKTSGKIDIEDAIWGSQAISWSEDPDNRDEHWIRKRDGIFLDKKGPRLKNLSGVFVTKLYPHNIPSAEYWIFENPFSTNSFNFKELDLPYNYIKEGKIIRATGNSFDEILQIPKNWTTI